MTPTAWGQCDALTVDRFALSAFRDEFQDKASHVILPETISEEPLGPVAPHGDEQWYDVVNTVMAIIVHAEASGVGMDKVPDTKTGKAAVDRLFGLSGSYGQEAMGLSETVAQDVIRAVGNYGEIYDRHFGPDGVNLPRENSRNALWAEAPCRDCPRGGTDLRSTAAVGFNLRTAVHRLVLNWRPGLGLMRLRERAFPDAW